jgi:hypothetical protein
LGWVLLSLIRPLHLFAIQAACPSGWAALLFPAWAILQGARIAFTAFNPLLAGFSVAGRRRSAASGIGSGQREGGRSMRFWPSIRAPTSGAASGLAWAGWEGKGGWDDMGGLLGAR